MNYFLITLKHKWYVFLAGLKLKVPFFLLILHDWTKLTCQELPHYQRQFYGKSNESLKFSYAWLHHQKNNKHHWEYWTPISGHTRGGYKDLQPLPMPEKYVREMVADWLGASRAYEGKYPDSLGNWGWWMKNSSKVIAHCHRDTVTSIYRILDSHFLITSVQVNDNVKDRTPGALVGFVKEVLLKENMAHIPVEIWGDDGEGLFDDSIGLMFALCSTIEKTKALFLYELAHAIIDKTDHEASYWHRQRWYDEYDRLCREHLNKPSSELPSFV